MSDTTTIDNSTPSNNDGVAIPSPGGTTAVPPVAGGETPPVPATGPADTAASGQPKEGTEGQPPPQQPTRDRRAEKRIASLTRKNEELLTRLGRLEGMVQAQQGGQPSTADQPSAKPRQDQFSSWEEYNDALVAWRVSEALKSRAGSDEKAREQANIGKKREEASRVIERLMEDGADVDGFDDVMDIIRAPDFPLSQAMSDFLGKVDHPAKVAEWLAENESQARKISRLRPESAVRELEKVAAQLAPKPAPASTTTAPPPVPTVGGRSVAAKDYSKMSTDEYAADWKQRVSASRSR